MNMEMTIGMRIKEQRKKLGMTQEELAEIIYTKKSVISRYENDDIDIKVSVLKEIARALGTTCGYLMDGEVGANMEPDVAELLKIYEVLNSNMKRIAIEQIKVLNQF